MIKVNLVKVRALGIRWLCHAYNANNKIHTTAAKAGFLDSNKFWIAFWSKISRYLKEFGFRVRNVFRNSDSLLDSCKICIGQGILKNMFNSFVVYDLYNFSGAVENWNSLVQTCPNFDKTSSRKNYFLNSRIHWKCWKSDWNWMLARNDFRKGKKKTNGNIA